VEKALKDANQKTTEEIDCLYRLLTECFTQECKIPRRYGAQALVRSAKKGYNNIVRKLVHLGVDVGARYGDMKHTALHQYALAGDCAMIEFLLGAGAGANDRDAHGQTPLHWAALGGQVGAARTLLDGTADLNAEDHKHRTPLFDAASKGAADVVSFLLSRGADKTIRGGNNELTPLERAERSKHEDVTAILSASH